MSSVAVKPRPLPDVLLLGLVPMGLWFIARPLLDPIPPVPALYTSVGLSIFAFLATIHLVPRLGRVFISANLKGRDLLKIYNDPMYVTTLSKDYTVSSLFSPECMGLVCAAIYILLLMLFIPFAFSSSIMHRANGGQLPEGINVVDFPHHQARYFLTPQLSVYLSSLLSLLTSTMLGFLDDVFDIRWRHKLPIPIIASIPVLMVYYAERGNTHVVVPLPFRSMFGTLVNLGPLYYIYMSLLSTFATNSINILAGINGSEVSQALIIGLSVILNDLLYLPWPIDFRIPLYLLGNKAEVEFGGVWSAGMYPARAFPGDTLCYVTGMAFAVVGIQAHFSKTLLLFFIPQIFNFLLSCPQLFGLVPCPRHRVPRFDASQNLLYPSKAIFEKPPSKVTTLVLRVFATLGLTELTIHPSTGIILEATNLTILNFFLIRLGPMNEKRLVQVLICSQVAGSVVAFVVRYGLAGLMYDGDRR
ncbi:UDP-N-acetylglucosamine--dolichyl-phosphate N-acetylglucosaminephosphotransferase [Leucoagaricus sp. SymC.cos]|nr:UDP-N-acetylglucosamine--dolichyl-phosphate N-acetylglucosaminephosphotransferase [Leucoagaricus sp. SymC.cos]